MDTRSGFGEWLKQQRKAYGYTQQELAQRVGCSTATISRIEEGLLRPSRQLAELVFAGLEVAPEERTDLVQWARSAPLKTAAAGSLAVAVPVVFPAAEDYAAPPPTLANPYKGLRAFAESDAPDFFGREALTNRLLARLLGSGGATPALRFLAVVGSSGCGKSSLVRAGLLPALRRAGLPDGLRPVVVDCLPGARPFEALESALLRVAVNPPASLLEQLQPDARGLIRATKRLIPATGTGLVLVLDQFEEVFTLVRDEPARALLLDSLLAAAREPGLPLWIVITLRADFYDRPLLYSAGYTLLREGTEIVGGLAPDELHRAIVAPAARVGVTLEPELVATLEQDAADQPGALPLLEYALTELCASRGGGTLTLAAYQALGGLQGALGRRAEGLYAGLDVCERAEARQLFLRLVTLGEGTEDTRRRVRRAELASAARDEEGLDRVLDRLGQARLLTFDRDPSSRGPTVDLAHEALLRAWSRLRDWLEESRADLRLQRQLMVEAGEWLEAGRDASYLATGTRLAQFVALASAEGTPGGLALTTEEWEYLRASLAERDRQAAAERERQAHELELTWQAAAGFAHSEAVRLAAEANRVVQARGSSELAALLAVRSLATEYTPQGDEALARVLDLEYPVRLLAGHTGTVTDVAWSPDGHYAATAGWDGLVILWDIATGEEVRRFAGSPAEVFGVAFSPDGRHLLGANVDAPKEPVRLWEIATGREVRRFVGHTRAVWSAAYSPDGKYVLTGSTDKTARLWDAATGRQLRVFSGHGDKISPHALAFSPDGTYVATGSWDRTARLWETASGREVCTCTGHTLTVHSVAFSPDGKQLLTSSGDRTMRLWDVTTGLEVRRFASPVMLNDAEFSPDGTQIVSAGADGAILLRDAAAGTEPRRLAGHSGAVWRALFSPDGRYVLSGAEDKSALVWEVAAPPIAPRFVSHDNAIFPATAYSPDGLFLLTVGDGKRLRLWEAATGHEVRCFTTGHSDNILSLAFSPDGRWALSGSQDQTARLGDLETGQELRRFTGHADGVSSVGFSPDGKRVLTAGSGRDHTVRIWDVQTGQPIHCFAFQSTSSISRIAAVYSSDGRSILVSLDSRAPDASAAAGLLDAESGTQVQVLAGHSLGIWTVALSRDGRYALTGGEDTTARIWDIATGREVRRFTAHTQVVLYGAFSPNGRYALTASTDGTARLWETATGREVRRLVSPANSLVSAAFAPDGMSVLTVSGYGTAQIWRADYRQAVQDLCSRLVRDFSADERAQYEIRGSEPTCPGL